MRGVGDDNAARELLELKSSSEAQAPALFAIRSRPLPTASVTRRARTDIVYGPANTGDETDWVWIMTTLTGPAVDDATIASAMVAMSRPPVSRILARSTADARRVELQGAPWETGRLSVDGTSVLTRIRHLHGQVIVTGNLHGVSFAVLSPELSVPEELATHHSHAPRDSA